MDDERCLGEPTRVQATDRAMGCGWPESQQIVQAATSLVQSMHDGKDNPGPQPRRRSPVGVVSCVGRQVSAATMGRIESLRSVPDQSIVTEARRSMRSLWQVLPK